MSNKPIKKSEQKRINDKFLKKQKELYPNELPPYTYIVSEGKKTEPHYLKAIIDEINRKYYNFSSSERIKMVGVGANTLSLLEYARKNVEIDMPRAQKVWLVYDKDDFPKDKFDSTHFSASSKVDEREYKTAWSNECFELWFLLHFQEMNSDIGRKEYIRILKKYIPKYKKNYKNIYDDLKDKTKKAIERAKRQYQKYKNKPPSQMCPATKVWELIEELQKYL